MTAPTQIAGHPRFVARAATGHGHTSRGRLYRLILLVLAAVLALAAVIVLESPILDVDEVAVAGVRAADPAAVAEAAGISVGSPLLLADLEGAEDRIARLPWVEDVTVTRDMPGGVHIDIVERTPAALVAGGGLTAVVDGDGYVITTDASSIPTDLTGPAAFVEVALGEAPPAVGDRLDESMIAAVDLAGQVRVDPANAVRAVGVGDGLSLHLVRGGTVELGTATGLDAKIEAFRTLHARVDLSCVAVIDVTVPERPVLTREEPCS